MDTPLTTHLDFESPRDAVRARHALLALTETEGYEALKAALKLREEALVLGLLGVRADEQQEYARIVGEIAGLRSVEGVVLGVLELGERAERQLEQE